MSNVIQIKRHATYGTDASPGDNTLAYGELAWNNQGSKLFIGQRTSASNVGSYHLNAPVTIGTTAIAPGGTATSLAGLTGLNFTAGNRTIFAAQQANNILTIGNSASGIVKIKGNLQVDGTTTTINSTTVTIDDKDFEIAQGMTAAEADEGGFFVSDVASLTYEVTGNKWQSNIPIEASSFLGNATTATASGAVTGSQASAITANSAKTGITSGQASAITANTAKTGITSGQASAITANSAKTGITSGQASAITANTAKTGISSGQASAITANTAKVGITSSQASAITANTAKTGITSAQASAITANTAKTGITSGQASAITANTNKISYTAASAVAANTAKTGITSAQASAITANTAKTGITSSQASAITANSGKTGITSGQASAITANTNKATNVTTNLSTSVSNVSLTVNSSDGTNASIPAATTSAWGVMTDAMFDLLDATIQPSDTIDGGTVAWS